MLSPPAFLAETSARLVGFFASLLSRCRSMPEVRRVHAQLTTCGFASDDFLASKLLLFTAVSDFGDLSYSDRFFLRLSNPSAYIYNTLLRGYAKSRDPNRSISLYARMLRSGVPPDHLTFPFLVKSCARLHSLRLGASVHGHVLKGGLDPDLYVSNSLVHMYAACGDMASARRVFDGIPLPNGVSWNSLVDGYAKCGDLVSARSLFDSTPERDVVSWSAMIDGYVKGGEYSEALVMFEAMRSLLSGPKPNEVTMVSVLCACAHLGALDQGRRIHCYIKNNGLRLSLALSTSLIDMYAKCGSIGYALEVFQSVPREKTDVLIWNAVIGGLAMHGMWKEAVGMFREMESVGIMPDEISYLALLSAYAHGGLVEDARGIFLAFEQLGMMPQMEHYACMVDVLCRAGKVEEAYELIVTMPFEPSTSVLGALLSGCQTHGLVQLGELVGKMLIELEPNHDGRYIGLSNVYAVARRWNEAKFMRAFMEKRGVRKAAGCSEIEVDGCINRFIAHDKAHFRNTEIYFILSLVTTEMRMDHHNSCDCS